MKRYIYHAKFASLGAAVTLAASLLSPPMTAHADTLLPWTENFNQTPSPHFGISGNGTIANGELSMSMSSPDDLTSISSEGIHDELLGRVDFRVRTASGSSIVTTMRLMSASGSEIIFEHVGRRDAQVRTEYLVNGVDDITKVNVHALPFLGSAAFHTYSISWTPLTIQWLVDGVPLRSMATPLGLLNGTFSVDAAILDACAGGSVSCDLAGGVPTDYSGGKTYTARIDSVGYRTLGLLPGQ